MTINEFKEIDKGLYDEVKFALGDLVFDRLSEVNERDFRKFENGNGHVTFNTGCIYISIPYEKERKDIKLNGMWFDNYRILSF